MLMQAHSVFGNRGGRRSRSCSRGARTTRSRTTSTRRRAAGAATTVRLGHGRRRAGRAPRSLGATPPPPTKSPRISSPTSVADADALSLAERGGVDDADDSAAYAITLIASGTRAALLSSFCMRSTPPSATSMPKPRCSAIDRHRRCKCSGAPPRGVTRGPAQHGQRGAKRRRFPCSRAGDRGSCTRSPRSAPTSREPVRPNPAPSPRAPLRRRPAPVFPGRARRRGCGGGRGAARRRGGRGAAWRGGAPRPLGSGGGAGGGAGGDAGGGAGGGATRRGRRARAAGAGLSRDARRGRSGGAPRGWCPSRASARTRPRDSAHSAHGTSRPAP